MFKAFFNSWVWKMALRESRGSRSKLLLFAGTITLGVAALVATVSFGDNLLQGVDLHSKTLVGADLTVTARRPLTDEQTKKLDDLGGEQERGMNFSAMVGHLKSDQTRLVQVRAVESAFPYYGEIETEPADAPNRFRNEPGILVEQNLMMQFGAEVGDIIKVGEVEKCQPLEEEGSEPEFDDLFRIKFRHKRRDFGRLRLFINAINDSETED